uniref:Uncharacterized protein n=1 Tax=Strombidium inclinatum TaxID=197538 RepID=A0A7S3IC50_9SPIT|mmetsp:Transcript_10044/g.15301  ORF Transcript_10044/g.15301 Transcript_10044/m.15301 type:complete len:105 (+) Transcript_10044:598-912(+)
MMNKEAQPSPENSGYLPQDNFENERHQIRELMRDDPHRARVKTPADLAEDEEIEDEVSSLSKPAHRANTRVERHLKTELKKFSSNIKKLDRAREDLEDDDDNEE